MDAPIFNQNRTRPDEQAFFKGQPVNAGTIGPNASANTDPTSYKNQFVSQLKKNPPSNQFYQQVFSSEDATNSQSRIDKLSNEPNFSNANDQALSKDFLAKYVEGGRRGLMPEEDQINQNTIAAIQSQQPAQGIGDSAVTAAGKIKFPGTSGTQLS